MPVLQNRSVCLKLAQEQVTEDWRWPRNKTELDVLDFGIKE